MLMRDVSICDSLTAASPFSAPQAFSSQVQVAAARVARRAGDEVAVEAVAIEVSSRRRRPGQRRAAGPHDAERQVPRQQERSSHHLDECIPQDVFSQFALAHAASRYRRKTLWFSSKYVERRPRLVRK